MAKKKKLYVPLLTFVEPSVHNGTSAVVNGISNWLSVEITLCSLLSTCADCLTMYLSDINVEKCLLTYVITPFGATIDKTSVTKISHISFTR